MQSCTRMHHCGDHYFCALQVLSVGLASKLQPLAYCHVVQACLLCEACDVRPDLLLCLTNPTPQVLSVGLASKLQERLEQLASFRAALPLLGSPALDGAFKKGTKDLPGWWGGQQDEGLVAGVLQHGFGNWGPMFEVGGGG
jgi:hypothetical protein